MKAIVVGAGIGGLATALRLAHRGYAVEVLERGERVGGRCRSLEIQGCRFDVGPTLLMMLGPLRRLFEDIGEPLERHLALTLCDPTYRVFFADGSRLDPSPNLALMTERVEAMCGSEEARRIGPFFERLRRLAEAAVPAFVERDYAGPWSLFGPKELSLLLRHRLLANLSKTVDRTFRDERLRMLFSFQTLYLGLSPKEAPWVYALLAWMECGEGVWYPQGGLAQVSETLARLTEARGATIRTGCAVRRIEGGGVHLANGETRAADVVVCNADLPYARRELLGESPKRLRASCSALCLYLDYEGELPGLLHHNVFFGPDFEANLRAVFNGAPMPEDPAFYACLSARNDPTAAPPGHANLSLLIPCPNLDHPLGETQLATLRNCVLDRLRREVGLDPTRIAGERAVGPNEWATELNLDRGAAFGLSHHFLQSAAFRPSNRSRSNPRLVFVGASTRPGNGVPMALISAELAERRVLEILRR